MAKGKNEPIDPREPQRLVDARWALHWARTIGLEVRKIGSGNRIIAPNGEVLDPSKLTRAACRSIEDGGMGAPKQVTREIDGENMSHAEQRRFRAKLQANTDRVSAALREVKAQVFVGITEPLLCAPTAELLALKRAVDELINSAQVA